MLNVIVKAYPKCRPTILQPKWSSVHTSYLPYLNVKYFLFQCSGHYVNREQNQVFCYVPDINSLKLIF